MNQGPGGWAWGQEGWQKGAGVEGEEEDTEASSGLGSGAVEVVILVHHMVEVLIVGDGDEGIKVLEHRRLVEDNVDGQ